MGIFVIWRDNSKSSDGKAGKIGAAPYRWILLRDLYCITKRCLHMKPSKRVMIWWSCFTTILEEMMKVILFVTHDLPLSIMQASLFERHGIYRSPIAALKGQCHVIFCFWFFHESVYPQPQSIPLGPFFQVKVHHRYQRHRWQIMGTISGCWDLKVNLKAIIS